MHSENILWKRYDMKHFNFEVFPLFYTLTTWKDIKSLYKIDTVKGSEKHRKGLKYSSEFNKFSALYKNDVQAYGKSEEINFIFNISLYITL